MRRALVSLISALSFLALTALPPAYADDDKGPPKPTQKEKGACTGTAAVAPGSSATNNDGVQVTNGASSNGDINLTPKTGTANCASLANAKAGAKGSITGLDGNDTALVAGGCSTTVSGTGGLVSISPGSNVNVINVGGPTAGNITVNWSGGPTIVLPGQSQQFNT